MRSLTNVRAYVYVTIVCLRLWQADLMDMTSLSQWNNQGGPINYLLVIICVFSKYLFVIPLVNKTARTTLRAFTTLFDKIKPRKPVAFQTDRGKIQSYQVYS